MEIGKLDRRIDLYMVVGTEDTYGQAVETVVFYRSVWAQLMAIKGNESRDTYQMVGTSEIQFLIRYNSLIAAKNYIIKFEDQYYNIAAVDQIGRHEYLKITCTTKDNQVY